MCPAFRTLAAAAFGCPKKKAEGSLDRMDEILSLTVDKSRQDSHSLM